MLRSTASALALRIDKSTAQPIGIAAMTASSGRVIAHQPAGRRRNPFIDFADLPAVLAHWNTQLDTLAQELASGFAANQSWVEDSALRWQDAWPLLRRVGPAPDEDGGAEEQQ
jgi:hypothetical protein